MGIIANVGDLGLVLGIKNTLVPAEWKAKQLTKILKRSWHETVCFGIILIITKKTLHIRVQSQAISFLALVQPVQKLWRGELLI